MSARVALLVVLGAVFFPRASSAQPGARLELSVSPTSISFPSSDPDVAPFMTAPPVVVSIRIRQSSGPWSLTVLANGDLLSGGSTVDISNVTWTATPAPPYQGGTLSKTVAQRMASGTGNVNPAQNGSVTFRLANAWTYNAGNYTQTIVFTLSTP
jgi:hypothetical protein